MSVDLYFFGTNIQLNVSKYYRELWYSGEDFGTLMIAIEGKEALLSSPLALSTICYTGMLSVSYGVAFS